MTQLSILVDVEPEQLEARPSADARRVVIDVRGVPHPQGSMQLFKNGGSKYPKGVYVWRGQVQDAAAKVDAEPFAGPVELRVLFDLPRPKAHYLPANSRRPQPELRADAPPWPTNVFAGDLDKYARCIGDAITDSKLWADDAQVVVLVAVKRYCPTWPPRPGVAITITELP